MTKIIFYVTLQCVTKFFSHIWYINIKIMKHKTNFELMFYMQYENMLYLRQMKNKVAVFTFTLFCFYFAAMYTYSLQFTCYRLLMY